MSKVDFKLNLSGLNDIMRSGEMQQLLDQKGREVMARAYGMTTDPKAEYGVTTYPIRWIAVTNVKCANGAATAENYRNNTLLKALGG